MPGMLQPLFRKRYKEIGGDGDNVWKKGEDNHIFLEPLNPRSTLAAMRLEGVLHTQKKNFELEQFCTIQLQATIIPISGAEEAEIPETYEEWKAIYDREVTKIDPSDLLTAYTPVAGQEDPVGDADTNLEWQPGKFSRAVLTNPGDPAKLFRTRITFAFDKGTMIRTGVGTKIKGLVRINELIRNAVNVGQHPILLYVTILNPEDFDDSKYDDLATTFPVGRQWSKLNFLTPQYDRMTGNTLITPANNDDWRRWADVQETTGTRIWEQDNIYGHLTLMTYFDRNPVGIRMDTENQHSGGAAAPTPTA